MQLQVSPSTAAAAAARGGGVVVVVVLLLGVVLSLLVTVQTPQRATSRTLDDTGGTEWREQVSRTGTFRGLIYKSS